MALKLSEGDGFWIEKKAMETHDSEDSGEGEIEFEGDEEDSDSNWDKDSFDGRIYHSSDDNSEYSDEDIERSCRSYNRKVIETKGFFEPDESFPLVMWSGISIVWDLEEEVREGITTREFLSQMARECVQKYNKRKNKNVQFDHFLRANFKPGGRTKYYITFAARDQSDFLDETLVEYQAKVVRSAGKTYPIFCRPSPSPNKE